MQNRAKPGKTVVYRKVLKTAIFVKTVTFVTFGSTQPLSRSISGKTVDFSKTERVHFGVLKSGEF